MINQVRINKVYMDEVADILCKGEGCKIDVRYTALDNCVYFSSDKNPNMLCIRKSIGEYAITNVSLCNKRKGVFSSVFQVLKKLSEEEGCSLAVENVLTEAMYSFCVKNGLSKIKNEIADMLPESYLGSYRL